MGQFVMATCSLSFQCFSLVCMYLSFTIRQSVQFMGCVECSNSKNGVSQLVVGVGLL